MERSRIARELEALHADSWGWALSCVSRDRDLAQDVLQAAYARILSGVAKTDGRSTFRTWVFGVIRLVALEELRRERGAAARNADADATTRLVDATPGPDVVTERAERAAALLRGMSKLSPRQQQVIHLVFYHGATIEDAARIMGVSLGTARTHYERGKQALAQEMAYMKEDVS